MSKQKSRPPRPRRKAERTAFLDSTDEMLGCCRKIRALAELLFRCDRQFLQPETVAVAGGLILEEAAKLRRLLAFAQNER